VRLVINEGNCSGRERHYFTNFELFWNQIVSIVMLTILTLSHTRCFARSLYTWQTLLQEGLLQ
jgi:hypothetical protein